MNSISNKVLARANEAVLYNIYLYLIHLKVPENRSTFYSITEDLKKKAYITESDSVRIRILSNALKRNTHLGQSVIDNITQNANGLNACTFKNSYGDTFYVFKGTGSGEWIDNGEGLSGIPEQNTYIHYDVYGNEITKSVIEVDYATDQQVEALNWFNKVSTKHSSHHSDIIVTGHSKGGNKAQFIALQSDLPTECYSFCGQGFSPEAIANMKLRFADKYLERQRKIQSVSSYNDFVNVLGKQAVLNKNRHYFWSAFSFHNVEAIVDNNGRFFEPCEQGRLSILFEDISEVLMSMEPSRRKYATLGIMNIFQRYYGKGEPVNNDSVSMEDTVAGIAVAVSAFLKTI